MLRWLWTTATGWWLSAFSTSIARFQSTLSPPPEPRPPHPPAVFRGNSAVEDAWITFPGDSDRTRKTALNAKW
jgi:hypothetical protein